MIEKIFIFDVLAIYYSFISDIKLISVLNRRDTHRFLDLDIQSVHFQFEDQCVISSFYLILQGMLTKRDIEQISNIHVANSVNMIYWKPAVRCTLLTIYVVDLYSVHNDIY